LNAFLLAGTVLLGLIVLPGVVCVRARPIDGVVALELCGALLTTALLALAEGFHRGVYFSVALVAALVTWIGGLIFARFLGRFL
jgi:multisubunit Na+/H+ antiporter MnhF subunit